MARAIVSRTTGDYNEIVIMAGDAITPAHVYPIRRILWLQSDQFWHGIQVECDFRQLAKDKKRLTIGIQPASDLIGAS